MIDECIQSYDSALVYNPENLGVLNNYAYYLTLENRDWKIHRVLIYPQRLAEVPGLVYDVNAGLLDILLISLGNFLTDKRDFVNIKLTL